MSAGALHQTPLEELTALPRSPSWFQLSRGQLPGRKGMEGRTRGGGKGGEKGEVGWNSALVVGEDKRPWICCFQH